ncbi:unnamed protein product [Pieris brassicae]|uniref:Cubilin n=1 Tax=Pieris brassicae TaxID=7116 RepID=A0A9P0TQE2_PIEBR|nr:unnamed protein product [Pieris brassicae]
MYNNVLHGITASMAAGVHLQFNAPSLWDYALHSIVGSSIKGNFTPTSFSEKACLAPPYFIPKRNTRAHMWSSEFRTKSVYFKPRRVRSIHKRFHRFLPALVVSGPLEGRSGVALKWSIDTVHLDKEETSVVFRLRYRTTTSATIYQVFFTKTLRLDCAIRIRNHSGRIHSGHLPRTHGCHLTFPQPSPRNALLIELHKLNVPCSSGYIRFAPNTPTICGKLEQIPLQSRRYLYQSSSKPELELHGRPTFAAIYRLVDHCHDVLLTARNGSFDVGPTVKLLCSYTIHLPYGNRVALRLQMGTKPNENSNVVHEESKVFCKGMELILQDGDSRWKHCSQPGDPLRSVQIISEGNSIRLNVSILAKKNSSAMWLKVWWMDKPMEDVVGNCDFSWIASGDFCVSAIRDIKKSWKQAEAECVKLGGHLASLANEDQQQILDQLLSHAPGSHEDDIYWIGATDSVHEGEFRWSDGLPFSYAHWFPGWRKHTSQPNDDGTSGQDCVEVRRAMPPRPAHPTFLWNDRSCREHNYFVCERPGANDPYRASYIQCNETIVLSHSYQHATVSSPGFPRPYPDDAECVTEIRAPPQHSIRLHFEELLTEHEPHCSYDFLEILEPNIDNITEHEDWFGTEHHSYNSENEVFEELETLIPESDSISAGWSRDSAVRRRRLCGDWGGKLKLLRYQSRGHILRIRFRSDHSRHYAGYRAKVTLADSQSCMDSKQILFNGYCYLFSGYPRASWTTAKQVCEGLNMHLASVHTSDEERFLVSGIRTSSDYSAGAVYWLGGNLANEELSWIDGSALGYQAWPPYNDTEQFDEACLAVQWKTSPVPSQPSGLYWSLHKCSVTGGYVCKRRLKPEYLVKNETVKGASGVISSPHHPALYDTDLDHFTLIRGPPATRLVFIFQTIDLEYQGDCLYDYIELRDTISMKSSRYCGTVEDVKWVSSRNEALLHFHSDYSVQGSGFLVEWHAVELSGCPSKTFTSKEGIITSPNYPHFLLPDLDCTMDILAPTGKRVFLNISFFDFGYGSFLNGIPLNITNVIPKDNYLEIQVDPQIDPIRPFLDPNVLTSGLFVSTSEVIRLRLKTGGDVTGVGFLAHFKTVSFLNISNVVELGGVRSGKILSPNWPRAGPSRARVRTRLIAPHGFILSVFFASTVLVSNTGVWPCGDGKGWIEVQDSYTDNNGTTWMLCENNRLTRSSEATVPLVINSYLHTLVVTQHSAERPVNIDVSLIVKKDPEYHSKILLLPDETSIESCYPNPCLHGARCANDDTKKFCQCSGYYTGVFCLITACERSPCVFGNCSLSEDPDNVGFKCACTRGYKGKRCSERIRPCASKPCNHRGACLEKDGTFLCQCNPSWKGKRCEMPNPTPNIIGLGARMMQEPFWLGLFAVFSVLGMVGLIWCAKRHFPEKIEKLLAEEADRCARPSRGERQRYAAVPQKEP